MYDIWVDTPSRLVSKVNLEDLNLKLLVIQRSMHRAILWGGRKCIQIALTHSTPQERILIKYHSYL